MNSQWLFRALKNRNYRLFFGGELVSMVGSWMQSIVQAWLVYHLSNSALWLGIIAFCTQFSAFIAGPIAGVLADQKDRRRLLIFVEFAGMIQALLLAVLFFTGHLQLWHIAALAIILGVCNSFEIITRHSFAVDLVGKTDLSSAISLNSIVINGSRIAGPALAGLLITLVNEGWCFLLNAFSYLGVIFSLTAMRLPIRPRATEKPPTALFGNFRAAVLYLKDVPGIRRILVLTAFISFVGFPSGNLTPVFAKAVLGGTATTLALLTGVTGIGGISGALLLSALAGKSIRMLITGNLMVVGLALVLLGFSTALPISLVACFFIGFCMIGIMPLLNTRIQELVADSMRGRVLSLYTMTVLGSAPLGSLLQGWAADQFGVGAVAITAGSAFIILSTALLIESRSGKESDMPSQQKTPLLVTGAAGFIGAAFVSSCNERGVPVISVDHLTHFEERNEHHGIDFGTKVERDQLFEWLKSAPPLAGIIHLGACANTMEMDEKFLRRNNFEYSQKLWNYAAEEKIPFVYASSAATYGGGEQGYDDDESSISKLKPLNPYGMSKQIFDLWVLDQEKLGFQPPAWSGFKFFNVYGFGEHHKKNMASVILHAYEQIRTTQGMKLFRSHKTGIADGHQKRDFIWVGDVVEVLHFALERPMVRGIYNLGSGRARTFLDLAKSVFAHLQVPENIEFIDTPSNIRDKYQYFTEARMDRLRSQGYTTPFTSLEDGVGKYLKELKRR